jgi:hypothetical protein
MLGIRPDDIAARTRLHRDALQNMLDGEVAPTVEQANAVSRDTGFPVHVLFRPERRGPTQRTYRQRPCQCGEVFMPRGPATKFCPACRAKRARRER